MRAMESDRGSSQAPPLWPWLLLCLLGALWINLGGVHRFHCSDSVLPILISVYRWTFTFWGSNHPGMFVPLLASPVKDLLGNLLVQGAINITFGLSAFVLLARYMLRDASYPIVSGVGISAFLVFAPPHYVFDLFICSHYGTWLALGLGALVLLEPGADGTLAGRRKVLALVLILLAHWVYAATAVVLGPVVVFRHLMARAGRRAEPGEAEADPNASSKSPIRRLFDSLRQVIGSEAGVSLRLLAIGVVSGLLILKLTPSYHHIRTDALPMADWPAACAQIAHNVWKELTGQPIGVPWSMAGDPIARWWPHVLIGSATLGLLLLGFPAVRRRAGNGLAAALALVLAATLNGVYMGSRVYVSELGHHYRYLEPAVFLVQGALVMVALAPLSAALPARARRGLTLAMVPLGALAIAVSQGAPSTGRVRADLDRMLGAFTPDLVESGCTHVVGDYFEIMPAVFHANLALQAQGEDRVIWGVTGCSAPTVRLWRKTPRQSYRVAIPALRDAVIDPWAVGESAYFLDHFNLPALTVVERRPTLWVLDPTADSDGKRSALEDPGAAVPADFDGDGRANIAAYWPSTAGWSILTAEAVEPRQQGLGEPGRDVPVPADYDGDGLADRAVYRPETGDWRIQLSSTGAERLVSFGEPGAVVPVPADYDGDGQTDLATYRPGTGEWRILQSSDGQERRLTLGAPGADQPVPADYDGDGRANPAVYRPATAEWRILEPSGAERLVQFGGPGIDRPVPADYDGDGQADLAVYRSRAGLWLILHSGGGARTEGLGAPDLDQPVPADYDGDGRADITTFRPTTGQWFLRLSASEGALRSLTLTRDRVADDNDNGPAEMARSATETDRQ